VYSNYKLATDYFLSYIKQNSPDLRKLQGRGITVSQYRHAFDKIMLSHKEFPDTVIEHLTKAVEGRRYYTALRERDGVADFSHEFFNLFLEETLHKLRLSSSRSMFANTTTTASTAPPRGPPL
jgi:hypothetical protein